MLRKSHISLLFCLIIITLIYIPNSGGYGVELPYNLLAIIGVGLLLIYLSFTILKVKHKIGNELIIIGLLILIFPWLLEQHKSQGVWLLIGGGAFWYLLSKISIDKYNKSYIVLVIFILTTLQSVLCLVQVFCPSFAINFYEFNWIQNNGRPYGIFQQVNLLASFIATGVGCGVWFYFKQEKKTYNWILIFTLSLNVFVLALNQSRTGLIGVLLIVTLLVFFINKKTDKAVTLLIMLSMAFLAGCYLVKHLTIFVDGKPFLLERAYEASTAERWKILVTTVQLILQKPWLGWGYGSFEYNFSRYVIAHPDLHFGYGLEISHPHNEILFQWYQGGIFPVIGLLIIFFGWINIIYNEFKKCRKWAGLSLLIIPLLVHINLEYPFYQSTIHFLLFIVLLRLSSVDNIASSMTKVTIFQRRTLLITGVFICSYGVAGLCANHTLTMLERNGLKNFPEKSAFYLYTQSERFSFDDMVSQLVIYNKTHKADYLYKFMKKANEYSKVHNDRNIWHSMILIERYQKNYKTEAQLQYMYDNLFKSS